MTDKIRIFFDIDDTLTVWNPNRDYENFEPIPEMIEKVNELYDLGFEITLFTARGMTSCGPEKISTEIIPGMIKNLEKNGVKYHNLITHKPSYDLMVDDKALSPKDFRFLYDKIKTSDKKQLAKLLDSNLIESGVKMSIDTTTLKYLRSNEKFHPCGSRFIFDENSPWVAQFKELIGVLTETTDYDFFIFDDELDDTTISELGTYGFTWVKFGENSSQPGLTYSDNSTQGIWIKEALVNSQNTVVHPKIEVTVKSSQYRVQLEKIWKILYENPDFFYNFVWKGRREKNEIRIWFNFMLSIL